MMISNMARLGIRAMSARPKIAFTMALAIAFPLMLSLLLDAYRAGLDSLFSGLRSGHLIVQSSGSLGEFYGSRLPAGLTDELAARGARLIVPEIHTVTGVTPDSAVLLRGIPLNSYTEVEAFQIVSGRRLGPADPARTAMIGVRLAERSEVTTGGFIEIRGRRFLVTGIFSTDTYADYEAWISLSDAQALLGWGDDVSVYVLRAGEGLEAGDSLSFGASVVQRGEGNIEILSEWDPFFSLLRSIAVAIGLAGIVALYNLFWRLAWMLRHDIAVLRSLGIGRTDLVVYLTTQSIAISALGYGLGMAAAMLVGALTQTRTAGISVHAVFNPTLILASFVIAVVIPLTGPVWPVGQLFRTNLSVLLRNE